ncbi:hypothetical protein HDU76_013500 [Blyttiomyces sp. JEL0837]|nr:hypothetical protein HDU76_013500 [Blyttiomyces sp. JEL0837]
MPPFANLVLFGFLQIFWAVKFFFQSVRSRKPTQKMSSYASKAVETASNVAASAYASIDNLGKRIGQRIKIAASCGHKDLMDSWKLREEATYAAQTALSTLDTTQKAVGAAVEYTTSTATAVKDGVVATATGAVNYAKDTTYWAINGATTTITAYTPGPVKDLLANTLAGASALRQDPVGTVKPYVPAFVIHTGEKTYEIVVNTTEKTKEGVTATSGFIYTKVNGTIQYVTSIPQVHSLIERLNSIASPVLNRIKGTKLPAPAAEAEAEVAAAAKTEKDL